MASQGRGASTVAAPAPGDAVPRQEGRKAQRDILCSPGLITAFIMLPKPREQPAPLPCVILQLVSL